jgi:hypothetical protein
MEKSVNRFVYHQTLIQELLNHCQNQLPFASENLSETDNEFIEKLIELTHFKSTNEDYFFTGQQLIVQIVGSYPHITPLASRDLFWYFGGDCLHFMSDEEMDLYNQIDEMIYESEKNGTTLNYSEAKAKAFKLH